MRCCCWSVFFAFCLYNLTVLCSRVQIEDNGYSRILVALPRNVDEDERARVVLNAEAMFRSSSEVVQLATKGRARFSDVTFLVPPTWSIPDDDPAWWMTSFNSSSFPEAGAALTADEADLAVVEVGRHPYVLHQGGCGRRAKRMIMPKDFLLEDREKGVQLARLWSEYRYGVFPEGGFEDDEKYPRTYRFPGEQADRTAGCSDKNIWTPSVCNAEGGDCSDNYTASLMDQHQPSSARLFCEGSVGLGPHHDPLPPSKHNLICGEESTWFTVLRNSDFARGRNAAPRSLQKASDVTFRFVREKAVPKVIIAVEISSGMSREHRLLLTKSPLHRFIYSTLPDGSEVTLVLFGGPGGAEVARSKVVLKNEESKLHFLESQPLPDEVSVSEDDVSLEELFQVVFKTMEDGSSEGRAASADIVVITTVSHVSTTTYEDAKREIFKSESRLHVMLFDEDRWAESGAAATLYDLCQETGGHFTSLHADTPLPDMQRIFGNVVKSSNREVLIMQEYLKQDDDVDLEVSFDLDESIAGNLEVYLSLPIADALAYRKTTLRTPSGGYLNFLKMAVLNAWVIQLSEPEVGRYVLRTRRTKENGLPVLITVTGRPSAFQDPITVDVWTESVPSFNVTPAPVKILAEVRKGWNPVASAHVSATIRHPDGRTTRQELLDDGLGDVDITKNDGIYGSYFTSFTDPGYYKVYVEVTGGLNGTQELTGPRSSCCGSFFSYVSARAVDSFRREAGPTTLHVPHFETSSGTDTDNCPPSRVTDLRITDVIDRIYVIQWTAVGDDYDSGFAASYELKVFRDSAVVRHRFSDSGLEVYGEVIAATPEATYGTPLNHAFQLPASVRGGLYFVAVRAVDDTGNAGEPSNAVPVRIEVTSSEAMDCESEEVCQDVGCENVGRAEKLQLENAARRLAAFGNLPASSFVPVVSLILSLIVLNAL